MITEIELELLLPKNKEENIFLNLMFISYSK